MLLRLLRWVQIAQLAPGAMVHGRQDVQTALFKPKWKQLLPGHAAARTPEQQEQQRRREEQAAAKLLWLRFEEQIAHLLDGWKVYWRWVPHPPLAPSMAVRAGAARLWPQPCCPTA